MYKIKERKGFTLAELLIVVAIIAVLVAVAIPVFAAQLEKSREATDIANVRSAYAQAVTAYLTDNTADAITVPALQTQGGWQGESGKIMITSGSTQQEYSYNAKTSGANYNVKLDASGKVTVN